MITFPVAGLTITVAPCPVYLTLGRPCESYLISETFKGFKN